MVHSIGVAPGFMRRSAGGKCDTATKLEAAKIEEALDENSWACAALKLRSPHRVIRQRVRKKDTCAKNFALGCDLLPQLGASY